MSEELKAAQARIACLEGEIAKRDAELAACRVAVENCDLFRARIAELESQYQRDVCGLNNEGDPIGGDPAGGYANDNARLRSELAAIKAQGVVIPAELDRAFITGESCDGVYRVVIQSEKLKEMQAVHSWLTSLNAAPAAPAADAGLVEALDYQALFDAIAAATSVYANGAVNISVQAFRESLAAHRAKVVV